MNLFLPMTHFFEYSLVTARIEALTHDLTWTESWRR